MQAYFYISFLLTAILMMNLEIKGKYYNSYILYI